MGRLSHAHRNLVINRLSISEAFLLRLRTTYGVLAYPLNEASGASFSGDGLPNGVISGTPTTYRAETNVPKSPVGVETDHAATLALPGATFNALTGNAVWGGLYYFDGARTSIGANSGLMAMLYKPPGFQLYAFASNGVITAIRDFSTTDALTSTSTYAATLRKLLWVIARYTHSTQKVDIFVNGVKRTNSQTTAAGSLENNTNTIYVGTTTGSWMDGIQSLVIPPQSVTLSDKNIFDIAVEMGLAQYTEFHNSYAAMDTSDSLTRLDDYGGTATIETEDGITFLRTTRAIVGLHKGVFFKATRMADANPTIGASYRIRFRAKSPQGSSCRLNWYNGAGISVGNQPLTTSWVTYERYVVCDGTGFLGAITDGQTTNGQIDIDYVECDLLDPTATIDLPYGPDLFDNGAGTASSGVYGGTAQGGNSLANTSNTFVVTFTDDADGAQWPLTSAGVLSMNLTPGTTYLIEAYVWSDGSDVFLYAEDSSERTAGPTVNSMTTDYAFEFTPDDTTCVIGLGLDDTASGQIGYTTNWTIREVL